ncbi:hypothetical protein [Marininema halotolerans]|uniref:Uncharacterized protein n=1 Tax=Marininema halotolerans TaxID=1155944 RepID=A0A1I6P616_9BACL|nr:hypothetical protein [Marininema halotolerans]SFS35663.1 hypothetical protein SAMN05444972_101385 [Marininema halotolerans]
MENSNDVTTSQASDWFALLQASNITIGDTAVFVMEGGAPRVVKGTLIAIADAGTAGITYIRVALSQAFEQLPVGGLMTILADKIVAFGKAAPGGD